MLTSLDAKTNLIRIQYNFFKYKSVGSLPNNAFQLIGTISLKPPLFEFDGSTLFSSTFKCWTISKASLLLSPSAVYLKNMQLGTVSPMCLYNFNPNPPPWMMPLLSFHFAHWLFPSCALFCSAYCLLAKYANFVDSIACCSCENIPVKMMNCCTCCSRRKVTKSSKNADNRFPATGGDRSWKHANRFVSSMNNSQAVVILLDGDEASETVLWS